jgi:serine/threonine protein kinase
MSKKGQIKEVPDNLKWEGESRLKFLKKKYDNRFGEISIYSQPNSNQKIFMKEKRVGDKATLQNEYNLALARMQLQHPNVMRMLGYSVSTEKGLCSTNYYLRRFFLYFDSDLRTEFAKRINKKKVFSDAELRLISDQIQQGLLETHVNGLIHGDVRPEMIGLVKDNKKVRVIQAVLLDRLFDESTPSKVQMNRMLNKKELFISPNLYKYINTKDKNKPMYGRQKNDFFGLGMCLLKVGFNNTPKLQRMYKPKGEFDEDRLINFNNEFKRLHGLDPVLCNNEQEYLGLQKIPVIIEEKKFMESTEETLVKPSNGQPPYKQIKVRRAEFAKTQEERDWRQISSWRTINTTIKEVSNRENVFQNEVQHEILVEPEKQDEVQHEILVEPEKQQNIVQVNAKMTRKFN